MRRASVVVLTLALLTLAVLATTLALPLSVAPVGGRDQDFGVFRDAHDATRTVRFSNPSPFLSATVTAPSSTGCACLSVLTPSVTIPPGGIGTMTCTVEPGARGDHTEAVRFTVRQGVRQKSVWVFVHTRVLP